MLDIVDIRTRDVIYVHFVLYDTCLLVHKDDAQTIALIDQETRNDYV
jgi:hypothetical protein